MQTESPYIVVFNGYFIVQVSSGRFEEVWVLAAPQGFEPRYAAPEAAVLPLNEGATSAG